MKKVHKVLQVILMTLLLCSILVQMVFAQDTESSFVEVDSGNVSAQTVTSQAESETASDTTVTDSHDGIGQRQNELNNSDEDQPFVTFQGETSDLIVKIVAGSGAFPEGTKLQLTQIQDTEGIEKQAEEISGQVISDIAAVDISFHEGDGKEIEPAEPVRVSLTDKRGNENKRPVVLHIDDVGTNEKEILAREGTEITFESDRFSVYALAYKDSSTENAGTVFSSAAAKSEANSINALNASRGRDVSSNFHATITTENDTYESGVTTVVSVKYTIDQNSADAGDYVIITVPQDLVSRCTFSLNPQHFSNYQDLGNGQYKLILSDGIASGLAGSFSMAVTFQNSGEGTITAGDGSKIITVVASGSPPGSAVHTDTIAKDAIENPNVSYGGYDYSDGYGDHAAQIGITDLSNGGTFKYRLFINDKEADISDATVVDSLPDGMTLSQSKEIEVLDQATQTEIDPSLYSIEITGQTIRFHYYGTLSKRLQVNYWVDIPSGSNAAKYTNTATVTYTQNGEPHQEHRNYVLCGTKNSAANGEKSVDKSIISTDPEDQYVIYTIKFWNSNGFDAGEINLNDVLDPHVRFVSADVNDYFSIAQDPDDSQKIRITNTKAINGSMTAYVRFMVDMTNVPVGYTVKNTVGGNTTKTTKYDGGFTVTAKKTINQAEIPADGQFYFQLLSSDGTILQTKSNDGEGNITFDRISYTKDDVGKTYEYQVREVSGEDTDYDYDDSVFTVTVTPKLEYDSSGNPTGKIVANHVFKKGTRAVDEIVFNNTRAVTSVKVKKLWDDSDNQDGIRPKSIMVQLYANDLECGDIIELSEENKWAYTWENLPVRESGNNISYTVKEILNSNTYSASIEGNAQQGFVITNRHTPEETSIQITKRWKDSGDRDKIRPGVDVYSGMIHLMNGNEEVSGYQPVVTDNGDDTYIVRYTGLPKYSDGVEIKYSIKEDPVKGYTQSAETVTDGETLVNTHMVQIIMPESGGKSGAVVLIVGMMFVVLGITGICLSGRKIYLEN
jgi:hypothetical protein